MHQLKGGQICFWRKEINISGAHWNEPLPTWDSCFIADYFSYKPRSPKVNTTDSSWDSFKPYNHTKHAPMRRSRVNGRQCCHLAPSKRASLQQHWHQMAAIATPRLDMCHYQCPEFKFRFVLFHLQMLRFSALCGPNDQKFGEVLT